MNIAQKLILQNYSTQILNINYDLLQQKPFR